MVNATIFIVITAFIFIANYIYFLKNYKYNYIVTNSNYHNYGIIIMIIKEL